MSAVLNSSKEIIKNQVDFFFLGSQIKIYFWLIERSEKLAVVIASAESGKIGISDLAEGILGHKIGQAPEKISRFSEESVSVIPEKYRLFGQTVVESLLSSADFLAGRDLRGYNHLSPSWPLMLWIVRSASCKSRSDFAHLLIFLVVVPFDLPATSFHVRFALLGD